MEHAPYVLVLHDAEVGTWLTSPHWHDRDGLALLAGTDLHAGEWVYADRAGRAFPCGLSSDR